MRHHQKDRMLTLRFDPYPFIDEFRKEIGVSPAGDTLESLLSLAISVEADLREFLLRFYVSIRIEAGLSRKCLQDFADLREAWHRTLNAMGIDKETMALAGPPSSPVLELFEDLFPDPDRKRSEILSDEMLDYLGRKRVSMDR